MSRRALAMAVRDQLWAQSDDQGLCLDDKHCELAPLMGQPPAACGQMFLGVWAGARTATGRAMAALDDMYTVNVTVSIRAHGKWPEDRFGTRLWASVSDNIKATGLDDLIDRVVACIGADCYDQRVMRRANEILGADAVGFSEPLRYLGDSEPVPVGPRWFHSAGKSKEYGLKVDIRFGHARRTLPYTGSSVTFDFEG